MRKQFSFSASIILVVPAASRLLFRWLVRSLSLSHCLRQVLVFFFLFSCFRRNMSHQVYGTPCLRTCACVHLLELSMKALAQNRKNLSSHTHTHKQPPPLWRRQQQPTAWWCYFGSDILSCLYDSRNDTLEGGGGGGGEGDSTSGFIVSWLEGLFVTWLHTTTHAAYVRLVTCGSFFFIFAVRKEGNVVKIENGTEAV